MKVTDLGTLSGDILLFGGVYSNLQSLEALLAEAALRQIPAARMICTGDVVGYCADPSACIARLRDLAVPVLAGNVERQLAVGAGDCGCGFDAGSTCDRLSADWYGYASRQVSTDERNWMEDLPDLIL